MRNGHGPTEQGHRACTCEEKSGGATANIYRTALKVSPMSPPISKAHRTGMHFAWQRHREEGERKRRGKREGRKKNPDGGTPLFSEIFAIPESESPIVFAINLPPKKIMEVTALEAARSSTSPLSLDWKTILGIKSYDQKRLASLSPKTRTFGRSRVSFLLAGPPDLWADRRGRWQWSQPCQAL